MTIPIPPDVTQYVTHIFATCNARTAAKVSRIPTAHETSLDLTVIEHFSQFAAPVILPSEWVVRIDTHYLGGGRHFGEWEVADLGLLVVFRRTGRVVRSKVALLQSKRLYPDEQAFGVGSEDTPIDYLIGFGRLMAGDDAPFEAVTTPRTFSFTERSAYQALRVDDRQYAAIRDYEQQFGIPVHYLLYHPLRVPSARTLPIVEPVGEGAEAEPCEVGCRVVRATALRQALRGHTTGTAPALGDLRYLLPAPYDAPAHAGGWRLEHFVAELLIQCHEGYVADGGAGDAGLIRIFNRRSAPIAAAVAITFDIPG